MSRPKPPVLTVTCPICKREFKTTNPQTIYCEPACRSIARQRRKYARKKRKKEV